jgi:hypothetical protein
MWISRKEYNFLKKNAEKNINAECEILKVKENQCLSVARAMEEYSAALEVLDRCKELLTNSNNEYQQLLSVFKCHCETVNLILTETIKVETGEESNIEKFKSIEAFAIYMKCLNDNIMKYVEERLDKDST